VPNSKTNRTNDGSPSRHVDDASARLSEVRDHISSQKLFDLARLRDIVAAPSTLTEDIRDRWQDSLQGHGSLDSLLNLTARYRQLFETIPDAVLVFEGKTATSRQVV